MARQNKIPDGRIFAKPERRSALSTLQINQVVYLRITALQDLYKMFIERSYNFDRMLWRKLMIPPPSGG
jgi:hypothetical protein